MVWVIVSRRINVMRLMYFCASMILLPALSSCGIYVHNARLATQTANLQTSVNSLNAPDYLAVQLSHLDEASMREDLELTRYLVASRDVSLLNIVKPPAASAAGHPAMVRLLAAITFELQLSAHVDTLDQGQIARLETAPFRQATLERAIPFYVQQQKMLAQQYGAIGGTGQTDCKTVREVASIAGDSKAAAGTYQNLRKVCLAWSARETALSDCAIGFKSGNLATVCAGIEDLEKGSLSNERAAQLKKAIAALQDRATKVPDGAAEDFKAALANLNKAINDAASAPTNEKYKAVFETTDKLLGLDLTATLKAAAEKANSADVEKATTFMTNLLNAIGAVSAFERKAGEPLDQPSAILIGMAKVRHDLNLVQLEIDENANKASLLKQQAAALRAQLHFLARAQNALCPDVAVCTPAGGRDQMSEALAYYVNSFNLGRIPYEVFHAREQQLRRVTLVREAKVTEADYRALIQPAIDQIAAYGAGGVKPEVLGAFLASLPVTGAIIAK